MRHRSVSLVLAALTLITAACAPARADELGTGCARPDLNDAGLRVVQSLYDPLLLDRIENIANPVIAGGEAPAPRKGGIGLPAGLKVYPMGPITAIRFGSIKAQGSNNHGMMAGQASFGTHLSLDAALASDATGADFVQSTRLIRTARPTEAGSRVNVSDALKFEIQAHTNTNTPASAGASVQKGWVWSVKSPRSGATYHWDLYAGPDLELTGRHRVGGIVTTGFGIDK